MRLALPKPSGPDLDSIEAAVMEELNNSHILGLGRCNARQQISKDIKNVYKSLQAFGTTLMHWMPWKVTKWRHNTAGVPSRRLSNEETSNSGHASSTDAQLPDTDGVQALLSLHHPTPPQHNAPGDPLAPSMDLSESPEVADTSEELEFLPTAISERDGQASAAFDEGEDYISSTKSLKGKLVCHCSLSIGRHEATVPSVEFETEDCWQWQDVGAPSSL